MLTDFRKDLPTKVLTHGFATTIKGTDDANYVNAWMQVDRQTAIQTDRKKDSHTDRQTNRWRDWRL